MSSGLSKKEKLRSVILPFNMKERLSSMLNILMRSIERLKSELREVKLEMTTVKRRKMDKEKL